MSCWWCVKRVDSAVLFRFRVIVGFCYWNEKLPSEAAYWHWAQFHHRWLVFFFIFLTTVLNSVKLIARASQIKKYGKLCTFNKKRHTRPPAQLHCYRSWPFGSFNSYLVGFYFLAGFYFLVGFLVRLTRSQAQLIALLPFLAVDHWMLAVFVHSLDFMFGQLVLGFGLWALSLGPWG